MCLFSVRRPCPYRQSGLYYTAGWEQGTREVVKLRRTSRNYFWLTLGVVALCSQAPAQTLTGGWTINVSNTVSPSQPIAEIEIWAWFDPGPTLLFLAGDFDLVAGDGRLERPELARGFFGQPGTPAGSALTEVSVYQLHIPTFILGNLANPIHVWSVFWETTNFAPRTVSLNTMHTTEFMLVDEATNRLIPLYPQGFTPGTGVIEVVPTPATAAPLVLGSALLLRRRRV
jgi:hypothetical protein